MLCNFKSCFVFVMVVGDYTYEHSLLLISDKFDEIKNVAT